MNLRWRGACLAACALALMMGGCGEKPTVYKAGMYSGKPDTQPWESASFKGNQTEWEKAIKARNQGQNENARMGTSGTP